MYVCMHDHEAETLCTNECLCDHDGAHVTHRPCKATKTVALFGGSWYRTEPSRCWHV